MEPNMEQPKQYTPEEIAQLEKSRMISDAELLKGGAEYVVNEMGMKENLSIRNEQSLKELRSRNEETTYQLFKKLKNNGLRTGDKIKLKLVHDDQMSVVLRNRFKSVDNKDIPREELEKKATFISLDGILTSTPFVEVEVASGDKLQVQLRDIEGVEYIKNFSPF